AKEGCHVLHLHLNSITDHGIAYLAEMLATNNTITDLYLGANNFGDSGVMKLCEVLMNQNKTLVVIDLTFNQITDSSIDFIMNMLKRNQSIKGFMLIGNSMSEESKAKLRSAAEVRNICLGVDF
ncbi:unnamed protein product, partial [Adineta ricciae]